MTVCSLHTLNVRDVCESPSKLWYMATTGSNKDSSELAWERSYKKTNKKTTTTTTTQNEILRNILGGNLFFVYIHLGQWPTSSSGQQWLPVSGPQSKKIPTSWPCWTSEREGSDTLDRHTSAAGPCLCAGG